MNAGDKPMVTKDDLVRGFRRVGLKAGMHVVCHSSLSRFGRVEGGADAVIDALEEVITRDGTLVLPTFSSRLIFLLEACALRHGITGKDGTGRGVVYDGPFSEFFAECKEHWVAAGMERAPFKTPEDLWNRIDAEGWGKGAARLGFTFERGSPAYSADATIRVTRDASPRAEDDVKPWKMPVDVGIIPERYWHRPETIRSRQYSGSFAAWGKLTEAVLRGHDDATPFTDEDHPLHRMKEAGGKILLLGISHGQNSTVHVAQWFAKKNRGVPYPENHNEFLTSFFDVEEPLIRRGKQAMTLIGNAEVRLADTSGIYEIVQELYDAFQQGQYVGRGT